MLAGHVTVNGDVVTELGAKADPEQDHIKVKGKLIQREEKGVYILLHKPKSVISTVNDPEGRTSVVELVTGIKSRIYPVGRLDFNTEGVLLLTNDGELANRMLSPSFKCPKTYLAKVHGVPDPKAISRLERGITVDGTRYGSCEIDVLRVVKNTWLKVTLTEGKNHQVKKMFEAVGHPVSKLRRIAFGFLTAKGVGVGEWRHLTEVEIARLKRDDFKPLVPISPNPFLRDLGVRVTLNDRERLIPYRAEKGEEETERPAVKGRRGGKPRDSKGGRGKWVSKRGGDDRRPGGKRGDDRRSGGSRGGDGEERGRDSRGEKGGSKWAKRSDDKRGGFDKRGSDKRDGADKRGGFGKRGLDKRDGSDKRGGEQGRSKWAKRDDNRGGSDKRSGDKGGSKWAKRSDGERGGSERRGDKRGPSKWGRGEGRQGGGPRAGAKGGRPGGRPAGKSGKPGGQGRGGRGRNK